MTLVLVAYVAAFIAGIVVAAALPDLDPVMRAAAADLAATVVVFAFSVAFNNSSFYDAYWSVAPVPIVVWWAGWGPYEGNLVRELVVVGLVTLWGTRLTTNWASGWGGLLHEDWRYVNLRRTSGRAYWLVSFTGLHLMPTVLVFAALWPVWLAVSTPAPLGPLDLLALVVTAGAIALEATADAQLRAFVKRERTPGANIEEGVWRWSRHPNYLGEILFWWGLGLFAVAASPAHITSLVGALAITLLFTFASIPMMERRMIERRPGYVSYRQRVPVLVPWRAPQPAPAPPPRAVTSPEVEGSRFRASAPTEPTIDSLRDVDLHGD